MNNSFEDVRLLRGLLSSLANVNSTMPAKRAAAALAVDNLKNSEDIAAKIRTEISLRIRDMGMDDKSAHGWDGRVQWILGELLRQGREEATSPAAADDRHRAAIDALPDPGLEFWKAATKTNLQAHEAAIVNFSKIEATYKKDLEGMIVEHQILAGKLGTAVNQWRGNYKALRKTDIMDDCSHEAELFRNVRSYAMRDVVDDETGPEADKRWAESVEKARSPGLFHLGTEQEPPPEHGTPEAEVARLRELIANMEFELEMFRSKAAGSWPNSNTDLVERTKMAESALEFYANPENWTVRKPHGKRLSAPVAFTDAGSIARASLGRATEDDKRNILGIKAKVAT